MSARNETPILVIDDEPPIRRLLRTSLSANGFDVLEAANGRDGLAAIEAQKTRNHRSRSRPARY